MDYEKLSLRLGLIKNENYVTMIVSKIFNVNIRLQKIFSIQS